MSDDYLKQLADWMNENGRQRKEEVDSMNDFPKSGEYGPRQRNFTRNMLAANPDLPQDDVREYVKNVKDDHDNMMSDIGGMSGGIKLAGGIAKKALPKVLPKAMQMLEDAPRYAKDLAEEYLPKGISDKVTDLYHGMKAKDNVAKFGQASQDNARIKALEEMAMKKPVYEAQIPEGQKPFDLDKFQQNLDIEKAIEAQNKRLAAEKLFNEQNPELLQEAMEKTVAVKKK